MIGLRDALREVPAAARRMRGGRTLVIVLLSLCGQGCGSRTEHADLPTSPEFELEVMCAINSDLGLCVRPSGFGLQPGTRWFPSAINTLGREVLEAWWKSEHRDVEVTRERWAARFLMRDAAGLAGEVVLARLIVPGNEIVFENGEPVERMVEIQIAVRPIQQ